MHLSFLSRYSRRPAAWAIALSSLGLAVLAMGPATGWSEDAPGKARVSIDDSAELIEEAEDEEEAEAAGSVRLEAEEPDEAGSVRIEADEPDEDDAGSVSIHAEEPKVPAGKVRIRNTETPAATAGKVRIKAAAPAKPAALRQGASAPRTIVPPKPAQASRVNPTARRYPFEQSVASARPAKTPLRPAPAAAPAVATANSAAAVARPSQVQPVQHQSAQRTPFLNDDEGPDETDEAEESAPVLFESEEPSIALAEGEPVAAADDCPAVTDEDVQAFGGTIDAATLRRPIGMLKADMQMRLAREHSSLMNDEDRAKVREKGRCAAEHDRMVVRQYYQRKYGSGYDRSTGGWSDESLAPEFPFCYHPLYFEDPNLERCGYSKGCLCQPLVSGFQFYGNVALLPIKMLLIHPCSYVYPQCDCDPCTRYSCMDNFLGPCPEGLFSSPCYSSRRCR